MRKHVIFEGPDGGGKDTVIGQLMHILPSSGSFDLHERASTSLGGPVDNLADWVENDVRTMQDQPASMYNRHPLVSEPIYSRYRRIVKPQDPRWYSPGWVNQMRQAAAHRTVLVLCLPPAHRVWDTVREQGADAHMPGVYDHILDIYTAYNTLVWPGFVIRYDYTRNDPLTLADSITTAVKGTN